MRPSRRDFLRFSLALGGLSSSAEAAEGEPPLVVLQPLGATVPAAELEAVSSAILAFYAVRVTVAEPLQLPKRAFYAKRQRYRAQRLLEFLGGAAAGGGHVMFGLAAVGLLAAKGPCGGFGGL